MKKFLLSVTALALVLTACADAGDTDITHTDTNAKTDVETCVGSDVYIGTGTSYESELAVSTDIVTETDTLTTEDSSEDISPSAPASVIIDAPFIYQVEDYPNGCESVSAVMALRYLGFDIDVDTFIDKYLPCGPRPAVGGIGPDPSQVYCGDPRSTSGWGCYSSVIANALNEVTPPRNKCSDLALLRQAA